MLSFRTEIEVDATQSKINYDSKLMFIGSCFANNIGDVLHKHRFNTLVNPFGVLYNPKSIEQTLIRIIDGTPYSCSDLVLHNDLWLSFDHHGSFSNADAQQCVLAINHSLALAHNFLRNTDYLFITFGTSWVYQLAENSVPVANCHKFPSSTFNRVLLNHSQVASDYQTLLIKLQQFNPNLKIVFTVSPVRHWKDGAHGNQLSKAHLLLAIDKLCQESSLCNYFPAYEIMLDELRDYRFYADDMLHPSPLAISYISQKLFESFFTSHTFSFYNDMEKLVKLKAHRPFINNSPSHQTFLKSQLNKVKELSFKYPTVDFSSDVDCFSSQLSV